MYSISRERAFIKFSEGCVTLKTLRIIVLNAKWHDHEEDSLNNYFLDDCYVPTIGLMGIQYRLPEKILFHSTLCSYCIEQCLANSILEVNFY